MANNTKQTDPIAEMRQRLGITPKQNAASSGQAAGASSGHDPIAEMRNRLGITGRSSTQSRDPIRDQREQWASAIRERAAAQESQRRASSAPVIPEAEQKRQSQRNEISSRRSTAKATLDTLEAERMQYAGYMTDGSSYDQYAKILADLDNRIASARQEYKAADQEYKNVYAGYNAARQELRDADRAYRIAQENITASDYGEQMKAAETRLANAQKAFEAEGGIVNANVIDAGLRASAAGVVDTFGYLQELGQPENEKRWGIFTTGHMTEQQRHHQEVLQQREKEQYEAEHGAGTYQAVPGYIRTQNIAADLQRQSAEQINSMKAGRSELGQFAVDMGVQGVQMGADAVAGKVIPGGSLTSMALRSFGSGVREAREEGADIYQQGLYGAGTAAVEVLTEKMFDGLAGIYGAGAADDIVSHAIGRFTQNRLGQAALGMVADAAGEGLEEVISDLANPVLRSIYDEHVFDNGYFGALNGEEILYDFLVGAAMGFVGGSVEGVTKATGIAAEDERSKFFMQAGQDGMKIGDAMRMWQKHLIKEGYATQTGDQSISNRASALEQSIDEKKFDPFRERKINRLNQQAASTVAREDMRNTLGAVEQRMQQLGEENGELAEAITMVALEGEAERIGARDSFATRNIGSVTATEAQHRMVEASPIAQRILSEMDVENLRGERAAEYNAFLQNKGQGATREDYERAVAPYQRSNEWVKTMPRNKALASDVYGAKTSVSAEEKTGKVQFTNKGGNIISGEIVGVKDGKVRIKHGKDGKYIQDVDIDKIQGISEGYRTLLQAVSTRKNGSVMLAQYKPGQNINSYLMQWDIAENGYGLTNITDEKARQAYSLRDLTDAQLKMALELGRAEAKKQGVTEEAKQQKVTGKVEFWDGKGKIDGMEYDSVTEEEAKKKLGDAEYAFASEVLAKIVNVTLVKSKAVNGSYVGAQGIFFRDGRIYLDVNAGMDTADVGQRTIVLTAAHELTHYIRAYNEEAYNALRDFVVTELVNQGKNVEDFIRQKQRRAGGTLSNDEALEEVIADACERMLTDGEQIMAFANEHTTEARGIWKWLDKFYSKWENAFKGLKTRHAEAAAMQGRITELRQMWLDALAGANENALASQASDPTDTIIESKTDSGFTSSIQSDGTIMNSLRTFDESGRENLDAFLDQQVQNGALSEQDAKQMRTQIEELYRVCKDYDNGKYAPFSAWSNAQVVSIDGKPVFSVVKANGEYKLNLDFSLVCKKRRTLDAVFNEMIRRGIMNDFRMGQGSIARINEIIRDHGFEVACGLCFVDSKRYRQAMIADAFCKMYNMQVSSLVAGTGKKVAFFNYGGDMTLLNDFGKAETIDAVPDSELNWKTIDNILKTEKKSTVKWKIANYLKNNPQARKRVARGDFMSTAGFDALKIHNPELLSLYNSKKGAGGPKAAQSDVQYLNEIIQQGQFNAKAAYEVGGIRIQSFSDYVGRLVFDYVQMVADLSAKKLPAHSYTKEFMFAQQFGLTGIKINMSLVPEVVNGIDKDHAGLDADGNYTWKDGQSFGSTVYDNHGKRLTAAEGFELAKRIQNAEGYSKNCGTIAVGVSRAHIEKMLDDPEIRMIIPYHKSGLNHLVAAMNQIDKYTDYTNSQNTRQYKNGTWSKISPSADFNWNDALQRAQAEGKGARETANEYLDWCKEHGYKPKFDEFAGHPNYYKLLEDFSCYDKDGATSTPLGAVQMNFPTEANEFGSMKDLIKAGLEEDAMLQAKQEGGVDSIVDEIEATLPEWEMQHPEGKKARTTVKLSAREAAEATNVGTETKTISENMTEEERYEFLKDKKITVYPYNPDRFKELEKLLEKGDYDDFNRLLQGDFFSKGKALKLLKKIGEAFSSFKDYENKDISVTFEYSRTSLKHSNNKQMEGEALSFAKMLTVFDKVIDSAIGIEAHGPRYDYEKRVNSSFERMYVLFSAYKDGAEIIPVRAEVNVYSDKTQPKLDVVVTMSKINEADVMKDIIPNVSVENSSPRSASTYMVADLLRNVNPEDTGMLKYVPDGFLDEQRLAGKQKGLEDTKEYIAAKEKRKAEKQAKRSDRDINTFTTKADIDAEISRVQDQIRDIQNAQWNAVETAKKDPRVQDAQQKMWAAEDSKGYSGAMKERMAYRRILKEVKEELAADAPQGDLQELADRVNELKALREQYLKVTPITAAQYNKLAKHFGTTDDYGVAGFILQDGRMLDFSGKKQYGSAYAGGREVYHNEVGDVLNLPTDTSPRIDMVSNGNIRLVPEINGINLSQKPTAAQKTALRGFIDYNEGSIHVDIDNAAGRTVESFGYYKGTSASKVLADIDRYFATGEAPAPQSDLRAFHSDRDRSYAAAVEGNDMDAAAHLVNQAAKDAGAILNKSGRGALHLYHGTPSFGFTEFRPGMIFLTDNKSIAAGYTANKGYGRPRQISEVYTPDDGTVKTLLKNIKNVLGETYRETNKSDVQDIHDSMRKASGEMSEAVNEVWQNDAMDALHEILGDDYTQEFENKLYEILALPGYINEYIDDVFDDPTSETAEDIRRELERHREYYDDVRKVFVEHYKALKNSAANDLRALFMGYDLTDFLIDAQYGMLKALDAENMLVSAAGNLVSKEGMRERVEQAKDVGAYDLYGFAGSNPLEIDGKGAFWTNIEVPELGGVFMTDEIGQRAKEQGYTSVIIHNIMDSSMNEYATNAHSDVYIFFDPEQVKSADPVTYDDSGNVIPLDKRFNLTNTDMRYSLRDTEAAVQQQKQIGRERLDKLRAEKNAKIEQIRKEETARRQAAVKREKAAKWQKVAETKEHYKGVMERQRNRRSDTNVRSKIKALHKELTDMLLKPKEGRYVPKDLVKATAEILGAVDTTSGRAVKAKAALAQLKVQYDALAQDPKYSLTYDETVSGMLQEITKELGDGSIYDLTGSELEGVYNTLKALKHTIQTANKLVGAQIEADAFEAANQMMRETENAKGIPTKALRKFVMAQMTPASFFRMAGGYVKNSMWEQMFGMLNQGQLTQTQVLMEGGQIFRELIDDKKNLDTLHDQKNLVDIGLKDDLGNSIKITRGMMLSVYMHLQNEQNARHISYGGLTVPRLKQYYKNQMADAFNGKTGRAVAFATEIAELNQQLSEAETEQEREEIQDKIAELQDQTDAYMSNLRAQIEKQLTEYDRKWIAAAQKFFDEYSKNKLNEVTEMVYGFSKAQVDHYFPIHTDANYRAASFDTIVRDMSLENAGFMKERINGANPILLEDITDVISSQLRRTAQYVGLMPAIRNFNKAYGKARAGYSMSVQSAMARTFENEGKKYIENLMADLNGARKTEANIFDELRGNMAGAVLTFNPRVTLAQAASFPSAAAEIGYTPLMKALTDMKNPMWDKGLQEEIAKWTPLWWYRMQGYSTAELGDIKNNEQFMNRVMEKMKWATGWIQAADGLTTGGLWQASKYYVDENFSDLKKGSDEYMMKVAEVYNRVLEKTQPDYTTMQRPDILRNPNAIVKQLTMFMTQRLQNMNILYDAAATYSHYVRDMDKGRNGVTAADVKQAKTRLIWAVSSQVAASATIVIFKALADALMHSVDAYRDDDDELTAESVSKTMLTNFAETITSNVLWGAEAFSWLKSALTGERYYGVSLNGVDTFTDMLSDGNKLIQKLVKGDLEGAGAPAWKLAKAVSQFFGASLGNVEKFVKMIANNIEDAKNGDWGTFEAGVDRTKAQNTHLLFDALQAGDTARADRLKENFKDEKDVRSSLKGYIKELYTGEDQQILKDETIRLLQKYCGMTRRDAESTAQEWTMLVREGINYSDLNGEFIAGNVDRAHAIKYLQTYKSMTRAEAEAKVLEWQCEKDTGIAFGDIGTEVKTGRLGKAKALSMLMKYGGKSEEAADKQVEGWLIEHEYNIRPSELQEEYMAGNVSVEDAFDILVRYKYNGKEDAEEKAYNEIVRWNFIEENPGTEDITVTQIQRYQNSGLQGVVDGRSYLDAYEATSIMQGVDTDGDGKANRYTKVDQQLAYIDGMDLTSEQKTSLALALGINEKSVRERAPWNKRR